MSQTNQNVMKYLKILSINMKILIFVFFQLEHGIQKKKKDIDVDQIENVFKVNFLEL